MENEENEELMKALTDELKTLRLNRIKQIEERISWMRENYSGCDWCCGGGDDEMKALTDELKTLELKTLKS